VSAIIIHFSPHKQKFRLRQHYC